MYSRNIEPEIRAALADTPGAAGALAGIEVKSAANVISKDFSGLRALAEDGGEHFHSGIVLYGGDRVISFGEHLEAVPITALWHA